MFSLKPKHLIGLLAVAVILKTSEAGLVTVAYAAPVQFLADLANGKNLQALQSTIGIINTMLHLVLMFALNMMQYVMTSDFFTNSVMMGALNSIWVLSRDLVNIAFALMLIGVAIYTVFSGNSKFVKEKLVHFLMAVILVNFSWFFPRVIIDVSNVLTATVFSIPQMLPNFDCKDIGSTGAPEECSVMVDSMILGNRKQMEDWCTKVEPFEDNDTRCYPYYNFFAWKKQKMSFALDHGMAPANAMLNGMVISFTKVQNLPLFSNITVVPAAGGLPAGFLSGMNTLLILVMTLIFELAVILPVVGLAVGFLVRIVILWVCVAFMPFTFLGLAVKGSLTTQAFGFEHNLWKEFVTAAFLPATVGIPIAIGFIMMSTVAVVPSPGNFPQTFGTPLIGGVSNWWALLWMFASVGILWRGSFEALKRSDIVGKFTEPLRSVGQQVFSAARQLPLIIPMPLPGMPNANLGTLVHGPEIAAGLLRQASSGVPMQQGIFASLNERFTGNAGAAAAGAMTDQQVKTLVEAIKAIKANNNATPLDQGLMKLEMDKIKAATNRVGASDKDMMGLIKDMNDSANPVLKQKLLSAAPNSTDNIDQLIKDVYNNRKGALGLP